MTHWIIYKEYTVRFTGRSPEQVTGVLQTPDGPVEFRYEPQRMVIHLPHERITINEYGWEQEKTCTKPSD